MRNDALICGRENDLVGFLYGELSESEATAFEHHLQECAACKSELAGFGVVRESVVAWRNESLGSVALPSQNASPSFRSLSEPGQPTRSAVAALREFFNLSPLWMKGALAFAAILFCVLAGLAVARLGEKREKPPVALAPVATPNSPPELNALIEQRVQEELKRIKNSSEQSPSPSLTANDAPPTNDAPRKHPAKRIANQNAEVAATQKARRPLSKTEREQLASDLRLVSAKNEGELDLLDDRINQ